MKYAAVASCILLTGCFCPASAAVLQSPKSAANPTAVAMVRTSFLSPALAPENVFFPPETNTVTFTSTWNPAPKAIGYFLWQGVRAGSWTNCIYTTATNAAMKLDWPDDVDRFHFTVSASDQTGASTNAPEKVFPPWPPNSARITWSGTNRLTIETCSDLKHPVWVSLTNSNRPVIVALPGAAGFFRGVGATNAIIATGFNPINE